MDMENEIEPMTDERLEEIRGHIRVIVGRRPWWLADLKECVAEVDRLKAELAEALTRECLYCYKTLGEDVWDFCDDDCMQRWVNIKTGQVDI